MYLSGWLSGLNYMKKLNHLRHAVQSMVAAGWLNKYSVSIALFLVWMTFFDRHNLFTQLSLRSKVEELESAIESYQEQLAQTETAHKNLMENKEKFAREKYLMHRPDEDVFLFE